MKTLKLLAILMILPFISVSAQEKTDAPQEKGIKEIVIQTSAQCGMCKDRIEKEMAFTKGVKYASLDLETKELTIRYKESKTTAEDVRKAVAAVGYDADDVPADVKAYEALPPCCKKGGHDK